MTDPRIPVTTTAALVSLEDFYNDAVSLLPKERAEELAASIRVLRHDVFNPSAFLQYEGELGQRYHMDWPNHAVEKYIRDGATLEQDIFGRYTLTPAGEDSTRKAPLYRTWTGEEALAYARQNRTLEFHTTFPEYRILEGRKLHPAKGRSEGEVIAQYFAQRLEQGLTDIPDGVVTGRLLTNILLTEARDREPRMRLGFYGLQVFPHFARAMQLIEAIYADEPELLFKEVRECSPRALLNAYEATAAGKSVEAVGAAWDMAKNNPDGRWADSMVFEQLGIFESSVRVGGSSEDSTAEHLGSAPPAAVLPQRRTLPIVLSTQAIHEYLIENSDGSSTRHRVRPEYRTPEGHLEALAQIGGQWVRVRFPQGSADAQLLPLVYFCGWDGGQDLVSLKAALINQPQTPKTGEDLLDALKKRPSDTHC